MRAIMGLVLVVGLLGGCGGGGGGPNPLSLVGGQVLEVAKGADADVTAIRTPDLARIKSAEDLRLGVVTTDVPPICTDKVLTKVRAAITEQLADSYTRGLFPGGSPGLRMDVQCRFFKEKGMIGGEGRLDWLVTLADAGSGEVCAVLFVEGVSGSPIQHGIGDMASENTKALIKALERLRRGKSLH